MLMEGLQHDLVISRIFSPTVSSTDERRDTAVRENTVLRAKCLMQLYGLHACPPHAATRLFGMVVTFAVRYCYTHTHTHTANHKQCQHQTVYRLPAESHTDLLRSAKRANADIIITGQYTVPHAERDASTIQPCRSMWRTRMTAIQLYQALGTQHRVFSLGCVSSFICGGHNWREDS